MLVQSTRFIDFILSHTRADTLTPAQCAEFQTFLAQGFPTGPAWGPLLKVLRQRQIDVAKFSQTYGAVRRLCAFLISPEVSGGKGNTGARQRKWMPPVAEGALPRNPMDFASGR